MSQLTILDFASEEDRWHALDALGEVMNRHPSPPKEQAEPTTHAMIMDSRYEEEVVQLLNERGLTFTRRQPL